MFSPILLRISGRPSCNLKNGFRNQYCVSFLDYGTDTKVNDGNAFVVVLQHDIGRLQILMDDILPVQDPERLIDTGNNGIL